jgi:hypothetical protein
MMLALAGFDEDEPPDFIKDRNFVIPLPNGKYITIPMPLGYNVIPATSRIHYRVGCYLVDGTHPNELRTSLSCFLMPLTPSAMLGFHFKHLPRRLPTPLSLSLRIEIGRVSQLRRRTFPHSTRRPDTPEPRRRQAGLANNFLSFLI